MKKTILFAVLIFGIFAAKAGTDEIFGEKLSKPTKVQVIVKYHLTFNRFFIILAV